MKSEIWQSCWKHYKILQKFILFLLMLLSCLLVLTGIDSFLSNLSFFRLILFIYLFIYLFIGRVPLLFQTTFRISKVPFVIDFKSFILSKVSFSVLPFELLYPPPYNFSNRFLSQKKMLKHCIVIFGN